MSPFELPFLVIGHRGAAGLAPENTLPSFQRALDAGVRWLELDVHAVDGDLLVIHDDRLERTTNGHGPVAGQRLPALRQLDAGDGAAIPLLGEVLDLLAGQPEPVGLNIELKGPGTAAPVAALLASGAAGCTPVLVSSFDHGQLRDFRQQDSQTAVAPLFHKTGKDPVAVADALAAWSVNLSGRIVDQATVERCHAAGYKVLVYTVNKVQQLQALRAMGVDGVFTDRPDRLLPALLAAP